MSDSDSLSGVTVVLTDEEREQIRHMSTEFVAEAPSASLDNPDFMTEVEVAGSALPRRLLRRLTDFRLRGNAFGTLLVRNAPIDSPLVDTPGDGNLAHWHDVPIATITQLLCTSRLGDTIAYADEKEGRLIQDVVPVPSGQSRQENCGTSLLELHTENGFHPFLPDYLTLLCLRPDKRGLARTVSSSINRILPKLSAECVDTLRQPIFRLRVASSFKGVASHARSAPLAVLSGADDSPHFVADRHLMEPITQRARHALDELGHVAESVLASVVLGAGDLLVVDNRVAMHGRTGFEADFNGTDRWLRRCFAVVDLQRSRGARPSESRVCVPLDKI